MMARGAVARTRLSPPRSTRVTRDWLALTQPVAQQPDPAAAAGQLTTLLRSHDIHLDRNWLRDRMPTGESPLQPVYDAALADTGRVGTRLRRGIQQSLPLYPTLIDQVPQLAWTCAIPPELAAIVGKPTPLLRRAFISLALARMIEGDWPAAATALAFPEDCGRQWSRYVIGHVPPADRDALSTAIMRLLPLLAAAPTCTRITVFGATDLGHAAANCRRVDPTSHWCPCAPAHPRPKESQ